jgi:hypothetical protein
MLDGGAVSGATDAPLLIVSLNGTSPILVLRKVDRDG